MSVGYNLKAAPLAVSPPAARGSQPTRASPGTGATIERGAPRWTLISNRRRPQQTDP